MAYKDSGTLAPSADYTLGDYTFQLRSNYDGDEDVTGIVARMTINGQTSVKGIDVDGQATVESWSVEANESEATVYATIRKIVAGTGNRYESNLNTSPWKQPIPVAQSLVYQREVYGEWIDYAYTVQNGKACWKTNDRPGAQTDGFNAIFASKYPNQVYTSATGSTGQLSSSYTYDGKTVYYTTLSAGVLNYVKFVSPESAVFEGSGSWLDNAEKVAWTIIYGTRTNPEYGEPEEMLIARFAIDIHEAGGDVGGDEGWDEPIDYEEGWEEGDPTHTLKVTIKGATSGRHNDPLNDPSYSYLPTDNTTKKAYGCGGDGGYGGGGGAGASTVIVYKFATDKANSKEVTAIARGHGYGSGGGKGGKGGDGCIIVYY